MVPHGRLGFALLLTVLVLASCASLGKPQSPKDTLLIVPVVFTMAPGADRWIWYYALTFFDLPGPVLVSPTNKHFVAVTGVPAGRYMLKEISLVPIGSNNYNNPHTLKYPTPHIVIETKERTATLAPLRIVSSLEETQPHWFMQRFEFKEVLEEDRRIVITELSEEENYSAWENGLEE